MSMNKHQKSSPHPQRPSSSFVSAATTSNTVQAEANASLDANQLSEAGTTMDTPESSYQIHERIQRDSKMMKEAILREKPGVITKMNKEISFYGITVEDLEFPSAASDSTSKHRPRPVTSKDKPKPLIKYRNGELTWSGSSRGKKPKWVTEVEKNPSDKIENYKVPDPTASEALDAGNQST